MKFNLIYSYIQVSNLLINLAQGGRYLIIKKRSVPRNLLGLGALSLRLDLSHEKRKEVEEGFANAKAGFGGEQYFDKQISEFRPSYPHAILHDVCLNHNGIYFQMDSVLITPSFIIVFEVKNIAGKLKFYENPDRFVRETDNGQITPMQSPVAQLKRKIYFLNEWLNKNEIKIPIKGVVTLAFAKELETVSVPNIHITFAYQVSTFLYGLQLEKDLISRKKLMDLAIKMKNSHSEYNPFPMIEKLNINKDAIMPGVICVKCGYRGMKWQLKKWICPQCRDSGLGNHLNAVADWFYLMDSKMTNTNFRQFMLIDNRHVAKRLLAKSNLQLLGEGGGRFYTITKQI